MGTNAFSFKLSFKHAMSGRYDILMDEITFSKVKILVDENSANVEKNL
jgi:hypothetical protein